MLLLETSLKRTRVDDDSKNHLNLEARNLLIVRRHHDVVISIILTYSTNDGLGRVSCDEILAGT